MKFKKFDINKTDKNKFPVFFNYIFHLEMVPKKTEEKLFKYNSIRDSYIGRHSSTNPISKIIDLKNEFQRN